MWLRGDFRRDVASALAKGVDLDPELVGEAHRGNGDRLRSIRYGLYFNLFMNVTLLYFLEFSLCLQNTTYLKARTSSRGGVLCWAPKKYQIR